MEVIIKCMGCHKTQGTNFDKGLTINVEAGSKCDGCGVEYNAYSLHCMNIVLETKPVKEPGKIKKNKQQDLEAQPGN